MGTSYNGTIPEAAATTGVQGLDAIVPISAISDWYDYYRANGMVRAPHSRAGGTGTNRFLGEDLDVLVDDVYSRQDENAKQDRTICRQTMADIGVQEDRLTGNRSAFWDERDYMKDVQNVHAAADRPRQQRLQRSYDADGSNGTILTRGWRDPENRSSDYVSDPITPGTFYDVKFDMQPKDAVVPAGRRLGLMIFSSDNQYTIRPAPGTQLTVDLAKSSFTLPIVGGPSRLATATGNALVTGDVSGTVPATLSLTLGAPASFGAFTPGVANTYTANQDGDRDLDGRERGADGIRPEHERPRPPGE